MTESEIRDIGKCLKEVSEDFLKNSSIDYVRISKITTNLLREVLKDNYCIPIDVIEIAEKLDIKIMERPLQEDTTERLESMCIKRKIIKTGKLQRFILIKEKQTRESMRFEVAYGIAMHLLHINTEEFLINECQLSVPYVYNLKDEIVANIFARFLLMPNKKAKEEFEIYRADTAVEYITYEEWCYYFGKLALVPYSQAIIGWEEIRILENVIE